MENLSKEEELILEKNLVWIFGSHRSGTSWLAGKLLRHNNFVWNEPMIGLHLGISNPERLLDRAKKRDDYFFSDKFKEGWLVYLRKLILSRINLQFSNINKKIIIKEPNGTIGSDMISESFPNSKLIIVKRDCRDVVDSALDAHLAGLWRKKPENPDSKTRLRFVRQQSIKLVKLWEILWKIHDSRPKNLCYVIQYEKLLKNTVEELNKLNEFLEIKMESELLEKIVDEARFDKIPDDKKGKGKTNRFATPGMWEKNLTKPEQKIMEEILSETLTKLDY